jgi:hypothetical protein
LFDEVIENFCKEGTQTELMSEDTQERRGQRRCSGRNQSSQHRALEKEKEGPDLRA